MHNGYGMGFGGGFMWLFWILLVVAIVWIIKAAVGSDRSVSRRTPREILDERYARGEIDETEYRRRRQELEQ